MPCGLLQSDPRFREAFKFPYRHHCFRVTYCLHLQCSGIDSAEKSGIQDLRLTATRTGSPSVLVPLPQRREYPEDRRRFLRYIYIYLPTHQNTQPHTLQNISLKHPYPPKYHKLKKEQSSGTYVRTSKPTSNYTKFCHATSNAWMLAGLLRPNIRQRTTTFEHPTIILSRRTSQHEIVTAYIAECNPQHP